MPTTLNPYRFYLVAQTGVDYYYINSNGILSTTTDASQAILINAVVNWNDIQLAWVRNERYHGIIRKQSTGDGVMFANDAARILREIYYTGGSLNETIYFKIDYRDSTDLEYDELYRGTLDFSTFKSMKDHVQISVMEGGIYSMVQAFENVEYSIPVDTSDAVQVLMDGITLKTRYRYVSTIYGGNLDNAPFTYNDVLVQFVRQEGDLSAGFGDSQTALFPVSSPPFFNALYDTTVNFDYDFSITYSPLTLNNGFRLEFWLYDGDPILGNFISRTAFYTSPIITAGTSSTVTPSGTFQFAMNAGETIILRITLQTISSTCSMSYTFNTDTVPLINCETNSGNDTKYCYRWHQVFSKLVDTMTNSQYSADTTFIGDSGVNPNDNVDAIPYQTAIITEQALKNVTDTPKMKVKLSDMQQDAFAGFSAGVGILNNQILVRKLDYFYDKDTVICHIGNIDDLKIMQAPQYVFNSCEAGFDDYDSVDDINKRNEFNTKQIRTFSINNVLDKSKNVLNLMRPFAGGCQYIELVRAQNVENDVKINNTKRDDANKNFLLYLSTLQTLGVYELKRGAIVNNIDFPEEVYNVPLSPARIYKRAARFIKSITALITNRTLKYQATEQVDNMNSTVSNTVGNIVENADINYANEAGDLLFKPVIFEFTGSAPRNFATLMETNPYGVITFDYRGVTLAGFVLNVGFNPNLRQTFNFQLLCSPDVDLSDLIY